VVFWFFEVAMNKFRLLVSMLSVVMSMSSALVTVVVTGAIVAQPQAALAADKKPAGPTVRKEIGLPLQEAQALIKQKKIKDATAKYKEAVAVPEKTAYEQSLVNEMGAFLALNSKDYAGAAKFYEASLNDANLPANQKPGRIKLIAQLYYQIKNYPKAAQFGNQYLTDVGPNADIETLVIQSAYLSGDYPKTISLLNKSIADDKKAGKKPNEQTLVMLLDCQFKLKKTADVENTLEMLVSNYPKPSYWQNVFKYLGARRGGTDRTEFETFRLKQAVGALDSDDYVQMAEVAMALGVPGDARTILQQGTAAGLVGKGSNKAREDRLMNLANTQSSADEKDLISQEKQAAASAKGDLGAKIGEAYMSYGQYAKAIDLLQSSIKKGGIAAPDLAQMHLGIAQLKAGKKADAIKSFKAVPEASKYKKLATLWSINASATK
jgi:tetratricopeptide (TPR) repeat protein